MVLVETRTGKVLVSPKVLEEFVEVLHKIIP